MTPFKGRDLTAVSRGGQGACPDTIWFALFADTEIRNSVVTNGIFVCFGNVEISHDELLSMAEREH